MLSFCKEKSFDHVPASFLQSDIQESSVRAPLKVIESANHGCQADSPDIPLGRVVLLVHRGFCNFTEKVLWAQSHGAVVGIRMITISHRDDFMYL